MTRSAIAVRVLAGALALSPAGLAVLVKHEGGAVQRAYYDSVGVPTVCVGHTGKVDLSRFYTKEECDELLSQDTHTAQAVVRKHIKVPLYQSEFDALVSFCFNVGVTVCRNSTLFALLNQGMYGLAADQFSRWYKAKGRDCRVRSSNCYGVWLRRLAEQALFRSDH